MTWKMIGAALIVCASTAGGFALAAAHIREVRSLQQLIFALEFMQNELQFRMPPLPELCRRTAAGCTGTVQTVWDALAQELDRQLAARAEDCMEEVIRNMPQIPVITRKMLQQLGVGLGCFDLAGQLSGLESVLQACRRESDRLQAMQEQRVRSYRTLGICAGLGLAILLI